MQGINRHRHVNLVETLLQLENKFANLADEVADLKTKRVELENSYALYLQMLDALAFHIADYEDLFNDVKVNYVGNRLKELKKQMQSKSVDYDALKDSIVLAYGT